MNSKLREEYKKSKQQKDKMVTEAAKAWVVNNVILINEQINRRTVERLIKSISKFDEVFGPYKQKLPALASLLDAAEEGLERVVTGRANDKKASDQLQRLNFLHSSFSRFFNKDLPVLLNSPLFAAAKENPMARLDVLQPKGFVKHNPALIRDAFKHALEPSGEDLKLIRKIYRKKVPLIDALALSNQMLQLSYNELEDLTKMGKVEMVAIPEQPEEMTTSPVGESVDRTQKKNIILESHAVLLEINKQNMEKLVNIIDQLDDSFNVAGLEKINQSLKSLISKARKELASNTWLQGKSAKQLLGFYNLMDNLNQQWPDIQKLFADGQLDVNDEIDLKKLLQSATQDSVFQRLAKATKLQTPHAPGLDPNSLVSALVDAAGREGGIQAVSQVFQKSQGMPTSTTEGEPKLGGQTQTTGKTQAPGGTAPGTKTGQTGQTATTKSSVPRGGQEIDLEKAAQDIVQKEKLPAEQIGLYQSIMNIMQKHGYDISKKG